MRKVIVGFVVVLIAGCNSKTGEVAGAKDGSGKLEPTKTNPVPDKANTAALRWIGFPFETPVYFRMQGFRGQTIEGGREYAFKADGDKLVVDVTWTGNIGTALGQSEQWVAEAEGIRSSKIQGNDIKPAPIYLPADPKPGVAWNTNYSFESPAGQGKISIVSKSRIVGIETVKVPLGTYTALVLQESGTMTGKGLKATLDGKTWFAEGLGMVKAVQNISNTSGGQKASKMTITISAIPKPKE